jgi:hypothetical protein
MTEYQRTTTQQTNTTDAYGTPAPPTTVTFRFMSQSPRKSLSPRRSCPSS